VGGELFHVVRQKDGWRDRIKLSVFCNFVNMPKKKVAHAMKAHRTIGIAPLILDLGANGR
jgi:hypothetical protein